jgi:acetylornithine deacetylase/succinyl-diaminopimelate desuccinylase-like protein
MADFDPFGKDLKELESKLKGYRELLLANLVMVGEIPSPTFHESDRIQFILDRFDEAGLTDSSIDDAGNGVGVLYGDEKKSSILLNAHADTVFPAEVDHTMQVKSETITGPGVADNSLGLATLLTIPYILDDLGIELKSNLILLACVKSLGRGNLEGIRFFLENNTFKISDAICVEGAQLGRLSYTSIGMIRGEITCRVPDEYDWSRFGDASAILTLNEVINKINDIRLPRRPRTSIVMGSIVGGTSFNTIARDATLGFEVRSESQEVVERAAGTLRDIVHEVSSKTGDQVELDIFAERKPGGIPYAHSLNRCALNVMENLEIESHLSPSTSELSELIEHDVPALTLGLTEGEHNNKKNETIKIEPIYRGLAQLIGTLIAVDGGHCD